MKEYNGRAVQEVDLQCLRELPRDDRYSYVTTLPVYVLECLGNDMVVTDFTRISNSVLAGNSIKANSLPRRYQLHNKPLELDYLFYIVLKSLSRDQLVGLRPQENFTRLHELGIVLMVEIQVNIALDGVYAELISWKKSGGDKFKDFMSIFKSNVNSQIYALNNKYDKTIEIKTEMDIKPQIVGSQLLFRHVAEDSQASLFPETQIEEQPSLGFESQVDSIQVISDGEDINAKSSSNDEDLNERSDSSNGGSELNQPSPHLLLHQASVEVNDSQGFQDDEIIKKVSVQDLLKLNITEEVLHKNQIYQISGQLKGYIPNKPFIIKPFNRTVKFANFKLIFQSLPNQIELQFNLELEICKFLKLHEVEEIFNDFGDVESKFASLFSGKKTIDIEVKLSTMKLNNRIYTYWTCLNDLDDLVERIQCSWRRKIGYR